jgi:hypothetical protein
MVIVRAFLFSALSSDQQSKGGDGATKLKTNDNTFYGFKAKIVLQNSEEGSVL